MTLEQAQARIERASALLHPHTRHEDESAKHPPWRIAINKAFKVLEWGMRDGDGNEVTCVGDEAAAARKKA